MERSRIYLATEFPWYAAMVNNCIFKWSNNIPTAGVGFNKFGNIELIMNPKFFEKLKPKARVGLLMHEILHVAMKHLTRGQNLDRRVANIAMDIAINQYIPKDLLPPGGLLPEQFKLPKDKQFEYYYIELMKKQPPQKTKTLDDHNWDASGNDGESGEELSEEMKATAINKMLKDSAKEANGKMPGSVPKIIEQELEAIEQFQKTINWKQRLRHFLGKNYSTERESTRNRPNRRQGFFAPGNKNIETPKILIGVDESGSVSDQMLQLAFNEIKFILDAVQDKTEIAFFDTEIAKIEKMDTLKTIPNRYARGGTNFQCIIDYAEKSKPDVVVIMTDGEAPAPSHCRYPILWVILGDYPCDHLKGIKININGKK